MPGALPQTLGGRSVSGPARSCDDKFSRVNHRINGSLGDKVPIASLQPALLIPGPTSCGSAARAPLLIGAGWRGAPEAGRVPAGAAAATHDSLAQTAGICSSQAWRLGARTRDPARRVGGWWQLSPWCASSRFLCPDISHTHTRAHTRAHMHTHRVLVPSSSHKDTNPITLSKPSYLKRPPSECYRIGD